MLTRERQIELKQKIAEFRSQPGATADIREAYRQMFPEVVLVEDFGDCWRSVQEDERKASAAKTEG